MKFPPWDCSTATRSKNFNQLNSVIWLEGICSRPNASRIVHQPIFAQRKPYTYEELQWKKMHDVSPLTFSLASEVYFVTRLTFLCWCHAQRQVQGGEKIQQSAHVIRTTSSQYISFVDVRFSTSAWTFSLIGSKRNQLLISVTVANAFRYWIYRYFSHFCTSFIHLRGSSRFVINF